MRLSYYVIFFIPAFLFASKVFCSAPTVENTLLQKTFASLSNDDFFDLVKKYAKSYHDFKETCAPHSHNTENTDVANFLTHLEYYYCPKHTISPENQYIKVYSVKIEKNTENMLDASLIPKELAQNDICIPFTIKTLLTPLYLASLSQNSSAHTNLSRKKAPCFPNKEQEMLLTYFQQLTNEQILTFFLNYAALDIQITLNNTKPLLHSILEPLIRRLFATEKFFQPLKQCFVKNNGSAQYKTECVDKLVEIIATTEYKIIANSFKEPCTCATREILLEILNDLDNNKYKIEVKEGCLDCSNLDLQENNFEKFTIAQYHNDKFSYYHNTNNSRQSINWNNVPLKALQHILLRRDFEYHGIPHGLGTGHWPILIYADEIKTVDLRGNPKLSLADIWIRLHQCFPNITKIIVDPITINQSSKWIYKNTFLDFYHHFTKHRNVVVYDFKNYLSVLNPQEPLLIELSTPDPTADALIKYLHQKAYMCYNEYLINKYISRIKDIMTNNASLGLLICTALCLCYLVSQVEQ